MVSPPILVFLLTILLLTTLTNPYLIHNFCEKTNSYTAKSINQTNLNLLLSSLTQNTPKTGFYTATEGEPPHKVYGLALCRGDISAENCTSCLDTASRELPRLCPYTSGGIAWYQQCTVRYSLQDFFSQLGSDKGPCMFCQQAGVSHPHQFKQQVITVIETISEIAAFNASVRMFATGINARAYGMVQCTRDLSAHQCFKCLNETFHSLLKSCGSCVSAHAVSWSCTVIYSARKFFDSDPTWAAQPDPGNLANYEEFQLGRYDNSTSFQMGSASARILAMILN